METKRICPSCQKTLPPNVPLGLCPECLIKSGFNTGTEPGNPGKQSGFVPPPVEELRKLFPQLEIIELIGKGGMGAVYKARQLALDRLVALKILPPGAADDAGFAERFNREARALARLNHPHIVAVHDFGQTGGQPYLVMELVDGPNLRQVEQAGRLTPEQALQIVPQICEALQFAHNEGVVHRDIKPENILLDKKGRVKITDFGIAKIVGVPAGKVSLTGAKDFLGTVHYMAPEQVEKPATVDHRADIYSLGVVFYELLTGELPLGKFQPPSYKVQVDVRLDEVVLHALEKEPERRYQQASQVKTDVETIAATPSSGSSGCQSAPTEDQSRLASAATIHNMVKVPAIGLIVISCLTLLVLAVAIPLWIILATLSIAGKTSGIPWTFVIPQLLLMTGCNLVALVGAWRMRQLRSYSLAVVGSILFMLSPCLGLSGGAIGKVPFFAWSTLSGVLLGLLFGIWSLIVLSRREVQEVFQRNKLLKSASLPIKPGPSVNESALSGARQEIKAPANWLVATGILNWIAIPLIVFVTAGILAGKGNIATAPMLLVPLSAMIFSSVMIVAGIKMKRLEAYPLAIVGSILAILITPGNIIGLPVGIWSLVVLCRREVREAFGKGYSPLAAETPPPARGGDAWKIVAVITAAVLLVLAIPVGALLLAIGLPAFKARERARIVAAQNAAQPATALAISFGPVQEVALNDLDDYRGSDLLDLDTGKTLDLDRAFEKWPREQQAQWLKTNGVDLMLDRANGQWGLITPQANATRLALVDSRLWEGLSPERSHYELNRADPGLRMLSRRGLTVYVLGTNAPPPLTFLFVTANGANGLLQITELTENPNSARLRFKVAKPLPEQSGQPIAREVLQTKLRHAKETAAQAEGQFTTGRISRSELQSAKDEVAILEAEITGDARQVAQVRLATAENQLAAARTLFDTGRIPSSEYRAAQNAVELRQAELRAVSASGSEAISSTASGQPAFSPVIELVVNSYGAEAENQGLDFESGTQFSIPERQLYNNELRMKWVAEHGIDLLVVNKGGFKWNLVGPDFKVARLSEGQWDEAAPEELRRALEAVVMETEDGWPFHAINDRLEKPITFAVQARSGAVGLLQLTGFTKNPLGLKLRYKLVKLP